MRVYESVEPCRCVWVREKYLTCLKFRRAHLRKSQVRACACLCVPEQLMAARVGVEVRGEACWIHSVYVSGPGGARKRANARGTLVNGRAWPCWFLAALSCLRQHGSSLLHSHKRTGIHTCTLGSAHWLRESRAHLRMVTPPRAFMLALDHWNA